MNREDLKNYKYVQIWIKDQTEYIETQKETINRLTNILSDMPKGSRAVYDREAEKLAELEDMFDELMNIIIEEEKKQKKIVEMVSKMNFPYRNILYKVYIQGKSLVKVADEMNYTYKYLINMHGEALKRFDKICMM